MSQPPATLRLALPKGRTQSSVIDLLRDASIRVTPGEGRGYRPAISLPHVEVKLLKPQNVVEMLHAGTRDVGFAGADWVAELDGDLVELLDTGLEPVRVVAAAPSALLQDGRLPSRPLVIASEFERLTREWVSARGLDATLLRTYGATEVFPPEDADCIVDLVSTGATLRANGLVEFDELMRSSTRLYTSQGALEDPEKRERIDALVLVLRSALEARRRVMLELNAGEAELEELVARLPCMREPTVARLASGSGYAVRVAVPREVLPSLIPEIKSLGGTDLVVTSPSQIVP